MKSARLKIAVIGANGRMGQELHKSLMHLPGCVPFVGVVRKGTAKGFLHSVDRLDAPALKEADVWIDFSTLESLPKVLRAAVKMKRPLVSGVTGLTPKHHRDLKKAGQSIPLLWSPNMSVGIAALKRALRIASELEDFDFQIEEFHHRHKKDRPSGTATYLQHQLESIVGRDLVEPVSIRGGGIFGIHKVWMMSEEETLCFEHQALNRGVFARGALRAASWLSHQSKGLYTMDELFAGAR